MNTVDNKDLLKAINEAMAGVDFSTVDPDANNFQVPDGYYLASLKKYEFGYSKKGRLQVACQFKIEENGVRLSVDKYNNTVTSEIKGSRGKTLYKYYNYEEEDKILRFANDMSKFEAEEGESLLGKDAFMNGAEILLDSLDLLVGAGVKIYVNQETSQNDDGTTSTWLSLVSWKTAKKLGLPM